MEIKVHYRPLADIQIAPNGRAFGNKLLRSISTPMPAQIAMSALPPKADIDREFLNVREGAGGQAGRIAPILLDELGPKTPELVV